MKKILILSGSLRKGSYTTQIAKITAKKLENRFDVGFANIGALPFYNEDLDTEKSEIFNAFRQSVKDAHGFLFFTPEYNRSYTPALKNALDIASRPYGQNHWAGKPGALASVTPGALGAYGAYAHLRQVMNLLDLRILNVPEVYISRVHTLLEGEEKAVKSLDAFLQEFADAAAQWFDKF